MQHPSGIYFDIQIGSYKDFAQLEDIITFELIETVGLELPEIEVCFQTTSTKVKDMILQNNPVSILLGENISDYDIIEVSILEKDVRPLRMDTYSCYFKGYVGDIRFILDKIQTGLNADPLNGMIKICDEFSIKYNSNLSVLSEINSTQQIQDQKMNWITADETYRQLMLDMWSHLDIRPSFPLTAITRNNKVLLKDFNTLISSDVRWTFTQSNPSGKNPNELAFVNNFAVENDTETYNIYAGHGKTVNIFDVEQGEYKVNIHEPKSLLGASQELDMSKAGNRVIHGFRQSSNVTSQYHQSYMYNVSRLLALSNICGFVDFPNMYNKNLNLLDLVNLNLADPEKGKALAGKYIVHTIVYNFSSVLPFLTRVYICRDCNNNLEDNIIKHNSGVNVPSITKESILVNAKRARTVLSYIRSYVNGTLYNEVLNYFSSLKYNVLNSFSIGGTTIDLNSQESIVSSLHNLGNNIFYKLLNLYVPTNVQYLYRSQNWSDNPNLLQLLNSIIQTYAPQEISSLYQELLLTVNDINTKLYDIKQETIEANGDYINMLSNTNSTSSTKVNDITNTILNNIQELNIPVPIISLTESQQLLSNDKLQLLIAEEIISNLKIQGYLEGFSTDSDSTDVLSINNFKNILLGIVVIDTLTISKINNNVTTLLFARYWGSFKNIDELSDFNVRKGFQDYFKTPNTSRVITALGGKRLYFAAPKAFSNLSFEINGIPETLQVIPIDLLIFDKLGNKIPYMLYYTSEDSLYNSASVTLSVIQS